MTMANVPNWNGDTAYLIGGDTSLAFGRVISKLGKSKPMPKPQAHAYAALLPKENGTLF